MTATRVKVRRWVQIALTVLLASTAGVASATVIQSNPSTVVVGSTWWYTSFGSGDVAFQLSSSGLSQCGVFWLRATDPGFKTAVAALLTATTTQATVTVFADTSQMWTGTSTPFCLVYMIAQ